MADRNYVTSDFASRLERARRKIDRRPQPRLLPNVPRPPVPPIVSSLFRVYNNASETIPQFAVMQVEDLSERTGFAGNQEDAYAVKQYDGTGELLLINAGQEIQQRRFGSGIFPSEPTKILIDPSASPSFGDQYGPVVGAWYLGPSSVGGAWQLADGTDADYEYLGQSDGETATFRQRQQHDSLVIGVTIASDAATTATVDSRPVGMARVPKETGGEVPFENPSSITIPEDGLKGHLVYVTRSGTKQWELIADSIGDGTPSDPPNTPVLKSVYIGITDATDLHALGAVEDVTVYINNSSVTVSVYNPLMTLPPQTWVIIAWVYEPLTSGGQWTIIGTNFTGLLGKAYTTYAKGETAGEVILYKNTTTSFAVNLTGVCFPFGGVSGGEWVSVTFNGWIRYAESKECSA